MDKNIVIVEANRVHFPWLDALRFIAAFIVLLCHTRNDFFVRYNELPEVQQNIFSFAFFFVGKIGYEAVIVFFVLSGFLVGGKGLERMSNNHFDAKSYMIDRMVRIGIPLLSAVVFGIIIMNVIGVDVDYLMALGNVLSLQGILCDAFVTPFWSLSYEVWFYVILGAIGLIMDKRKLGMFLFVVCCLVFVKLSPYFLLIWLMGAFAYYLRPMHFNKVVLYLSFGLVCLFTCLSIGGAESKAIHVPFTINRNIADVFLAFSLCLFIQQLVLCPPRNRLTIKIERAFHYLANFSYTLYLTHRITLLFIFHVVFDKWSHVLDGKGIALYVCMLFFCVAISWCIYFCTERHTAVVKKWIKRKWLIEK